MGTPCKSACSPWTNSAAVLACGSCDDLVADPDLVGDSINVASDILFELSGRQFPGACRDIVRPCSRAIYDDAPVRYTGDWRAVPGCGCNRGRQCGCSRLDEITLGGYPVQRIVEVKVDGAVLDPSRYRVDDWRYLVRLPDANGSNPGWPCCQRLDLADTQPDTFSVDFVYGVGPPPAGVRAVNDLACQLILACQGSSACQLPTRVTAVVRQGVSVSLDPAEFLKEGRTGVFTADLFLRTYNPAGISRRAQVLSPDIGRRVRRAGT